MRGNVRPVLHKQEFRCKLFSNKKFVNIIACDIHLGRKGLTNRLG